MPLRQGLVPGRSLAATRPRGTGPASAHSPPRQSTGTRCVEPSWHLPPGSGARLKSALPDTDVYGAIRMPTRMGFVVFMPQAEGARGRALAGAAAVPTRERPLQGGVEGGYIDRFRDKPCGLGGLDPLAGRGIDMGAHVDH